MTNIVDCFKARVFPDGDSPEDDKLYVIALFDYEENEIIHMTVGDSKTEFDKGLMLLHDWMDENVRTPLDPELSEEALWMETQQRKLDGIHVVQYMYQREWITEDQFKWYLMMRDGNHPASTETDFGEEKVTPSIKKLLT